MCPGKHTRQFIEELVRLAQKPRLPAGRMGYTTDDWVGMDIMTPEIKRGGKGSDQPVSRPTVFLRQQTGRWLSLRTA